MLKKILTWGSGPVLAALFLWLAFRGVDFERLAEAFRQASVPILLFSVATIPVHLALRSMRWRTLLGPHGRDVPFRELYSAVAIGYMASLLPGRVGEVLRPALLSRRTGTPLGTTIATVGVERLLLDLMAIFLLGGVGLALPSAISGLKPDADPTLLTRLRLGGLIALGVTLVLLVATHLVARSRHRIERRVRAWMEARDNRVLNKVVGAFLSLLPGIGTFATLLGTLRLLGETLAVWASIWLGVWAGIVGSGVDLSPVGGLIMQPILALGIGIPSPGGTGSFHYAMKLGLTELFDVPNASAVAAGIIVHAITWLPLIFLGGAFIMRGGLVKARVNARAGEALS